MKPLALALLLSGSMLWAQATTPQTPPPGAKEKTGAGAAQSTHQHGAMMQHNMAQQMQSMLDQMKARMDKMQSDLANVKDPAAKDALQADYDMWQTMYSHIQGMMHEHMQAQGGMMGHGMMGQGMMGHGMMHSTPAKPGTGKQGTTTPPQQR